MNVMPETIWEQIWGDPGCCTMRLPLPISYVWKHIKRDEYVFLHDDERARDGLDPWKRITITELSPTLPHTEDPNTFLITFNDNGSMKVADDFLIFIARTSLLRQ